MKESSRKQPRLLGKAGFQLEGEKEEKHYSLYQERAELYNQKKRSRKNGKCKVAPSNKDAGPIPVRMFHTGCHRVP